MQDANCFHFACGIQLVTHSVPSGRHPVHDWISHLLLSAPVILLKQCANFFLKVLLRGAIEAAHVDPTSLERPILDGCLHKSAGFLALLLVEAFFVSPLTRRILVLTKMKARSWHAARTSWTISRSFGSCPCVSMNNPCLSLKQQKKPREAKNAECATKFGTARRKTFLSVQEPSQQGKKPNWKAQLSAIK